MSFAFRTIPLDCLALTCQYLNAMHDHCAIHSTSHHWRRILIAAQDRYSHAYVSIAHSLTIEWRKKEIGDHLTAKNHQEERRQFMDLQILAGIQLSFSQLRSLSITFNIPSGSKRLKRQTELLRLGFYSLLRSLTSIEGLSIIDVSPPIENPTHPQELFLLFPHDDLARAMARIHTLRTIHYEVNWIRNLISKKNNLGFSEFQPPAMSSGLISVLVQSSRLTTISGGALLQSMTEDHWLTLLSSLPHLRGVSSVDLKTLRRLHSIATRPLFEHSDLRRLVAQSQIGSLDRIEAVYPYYSYSWHFSEMTEWISSLAEMIRTNVRLVRLGASGINGKCIHFQALPRGGEVVWSQLVTKEEREEVRGQHSLRSLAFDLSSNYTLNERSFTPIILAQVHQLALSYRLQVDVSFLASLPSLRCLMLYSQTLTEDEFRQILKASSRLLKLRLGELKILKGRPPVDEPDSRESVTQIVAQIIETHSSLHLLKVRKLVITSKASKRIPVPQRWHIRSDDLKAASTRCAKMLEYVQKLNWIDLVTLPRDEIKKRIATPA